MKEQILASLDAVERERQARDSDAPLAQKVLLVKRYQQLRFERTYADLLVSTRYSRATHFFLAELYGPTDFRRRDQQFARVVPKLVRLFPEEAVSTVAALARLHALSEVLDTQMARCLVDGIVTRGIYASAWQQVGRAEERQRQVELVLSIGQALDRLTRHAWTVAAVRMMRAPARAAGLSELQVFLENGMDSFRAMSGAESFLVTISSREQALIAELFAVDSAALTADPPVLATDGNTRLADLPIIV